MPDRDDEKPISYRDAGVDIDEGARAVESIRDAVRSTYRPEVIGDIGGFGGMFSAAAFKDMTDPVMVSGTDGVGTKLLVAIAAGRHDTVGQDLVNHCVNDILTTGARPLFFLDYYATGKLSPDVAERIILGFVTACRENGCALVGGETAEMPGVYSGEDYDLAGTIVGIVERKRMLSRQDVRAGDVLIGLPSTGLHTNGYSLARAVLFKTYTVDSQVPELGCPLADALLAVHRSYLHTVHPLLGRHPVVGLSHITGGGIAGNTRRVIAPGLALEIDWSAWERPRLFSLIQELGAVPEEDMRRTFNLGIGFVLIVREEGVQTLLRELSPERPCVIGRVVAS